VHPTNTNVGETAEAQWLQKLGGTLYSQVEAGVTHVVTKRAGTEKTLQGRRLGAWVVSLDWLWYSVWYGQRLPESDFEFETMKRDSPPARGDDDGHPASQGSGDVSGVLSDGSQQDEEASDDDAIIGEDLIQALVS
jgi:hypothetical protein